MKKTILSLTAALLMIGLFAAFTRISPVTPELTKDTGGDFQTFLKQFKSADLPFSITKEELQKVMEQGLKDEDDIKPAGDKRVKDPDHFLPNSRMKYVSRVPMYNIPVARLATTQHTAVIYATVRGFSSAYSDYEVAVYTKSGALVASHHLASTGPSRLVAATVDKKLHATIQSYLINWEKDLDENGVDGNAITGLSLESSKTVNLTTKSTSEEWKFKTQPVKLDPPVTQKVGAR